MRSSFWLCLIALCASIGVIRVSSSLARSDPAAPPAVAPSPPAPPAAPAPKGKPAKKHRLRALERLQQAAAVPEPGPDPAWVVDGYDLEDADAAQQAAMRKAAESVQEYINKHYGSLGFKPTLEQLVKAGVVRPEGTPGTRELKDGEVKEAHAKVEMTRSYREGLQRMVLQQHTRQRQWLAARALGGFVALLLVCGGYMRLEEATRGYYTRLLRLAAFGVLVGVGVGLWLL
jgi:hypothetical protein